MSRWLLLLPLGLGLGLLLAVRLTSDVEWSTAALRGAVEELGIWGPVTMVLIVAFRLPLLLNSQIVLTVAGACFGTWEGAAYGALGSWLTGILVFATMRTADAERATRRVPPNLRRTLERAGVAGAAGLMALGTALPFGPTTLYHAAASLTRMGPLTFALALAVGVVPRALTYAAFGNELAEGNLRDAAWLAALLLAPLLALLHPRARWWLRRQLRPIDDP